MPCINFNLQPGGPILTALIGPSQPRVQALSASGSPVPNFVPGTFLVDTGASCTCVDLDVIQALALQPTGRVAISTPSTSAGQKHLCDQYDVALFIPGNIPGTGYSLGALAVITTHLKSQGIEGLIGRDVLSNCTLIYNGSAFICTLAY